VQDTARILHLEDNPRDAELIADALQHQGVKVSWTVVDAPEGFAEALQLGAFDLILSDFTVPNFSGFDALDAAKACQPDVPFIFVSGTIGEETAVEAMKRGATDYVIKDKIFKLGAVVQRALTESSLRARQGLAEAKMRDSEHLFRTLLESSPDSVVLLDRDLRYLYANPEAGRVLNMSLEEVIGKSVSDVLPANLAEVVVADLRRVFDRGETIFRDASTEISLGDISVDSRLVPITDNAGNVISVLGIARDITARRKAEQILRESEEKFRSFAEGSPNVIFISRNGRLLYVNDRCREVLGFSKDELLDAAFPWPSMVEPEYAERITRHISLNSGKSEHPPAEYKGLRKDGSRLHFVFNATLIRYDGVPALLGVLTDISELKKAESENAMIRDRLRQAEKLEAIGSLAGGVAHDFNNILMVILSYSDFILGKLPVEGPLRKEMEQIKKAGNKAAELTSHLLAFSRKQALVPKEIDPNEAVKSLSKMIERLVGDDFRLVTDLQPDIGSIMSDPSQFDQILINLVVNSRDAMKDGGDVTIQTRGVTLAAGDLAEDPGAPPGEYIRVSVIDAGPGIPAEIMDRIFDPFFTTKPEGKGTGLGLSMVYGATKQNNGFLQVASTPHTGTTFHLYFSRITHPAARSGAGMEEAALVLSGITILLVEDDENVRQATKMMLEISGGVVIEASNGSDALRLYRDKASTIGIVLSDVVMPGMGGAELGKKLREVKPDVKLIFCTGYFDRIHELTTALGETPQIITKPYDRAELVRRIRLLLGDADRRRPLKLGQA
jgi:two-component system cell cycle sensor histidine kinase/response regulator CckA